MTSAGIAGAVVAAATAEAAAAGSASVAAAQEEATTAAAAAAAAASVAAGVHTVAVNQDTTAGLGRGATSGGISTSGAERPTIFTEAALARRLHVQGLKVHERRRATALATALATTKLYWLAIGAMLDDAVLADQQVDVFGDGGLETSITRECWLESEVSYFITVWCAQSFHSSD
jgi:dihydroxyacetone kinase